MLSDPKKIPGKRIDFARIRQESIPHIPAIVERWLPDGRRESNNWVALNPRRNDRTHGSFKIHLDEGYWCDFASGDKGGDIISLAAFLFGLSQVEAARRVSEMLGLSHG